MEFYKSHLNLTPFPHMNHYQLIMGSHSLFPRPSFVPHAIQSVHHSLIYKPLIRIASESSPQFTTNDFSVSSRDIKVFKNLIESETVRKFLEWDRCNMLADKYLLAAAFTYFKRAKLSHHQYTPVYLFVALYLAHDMEEDDFDIKNDLIRFAMCCDGPSKSVNRQTIKLFMRKKDKLWHAMDMRAAVNHLCLESIMQQIMPNHSIWKRERNTDHGGGAVPAMLKTYVHNDLRLVNSYVECNIRCIICTARNYKMSIESSTKSQMKEFNDRKRFPLKRNAVFHYHEE